MFVGTLEVQYLQKMVGSSFSAFSKIVIASEGIESHIKKVKLPSTANASSGAKKPHSNFQKRNDGEENFIMGSLRRNEAHYHLLYNQVAAIASIQYQ